MESSFQSNKHSAGHKRSMSDHKSDNTREGFDSERKVKRDASADASSSSVPQAAEAFRKARKIAKDQIQFASAASRQM